MKLIINTVAKGGPHGQGTMDVPETLLHRAYEAFTEALPLLGKGQDSVVALKASFDFPANGGETIESSFRAVIVVDGKKVKCDDIQADGKERTSVLAKAIVNSITAGFEHEIGRHREKVRQISENLRDFKPPREASKKK